MAQQPIPADWDGASYCCFVVDWPDSQQWRAILAGLLTMPTRGRFWDASTGSITDAQAVGASIENRNCLFTEAQVTCLDDLNIALTSISNSLSLTVPSDGGCKGYGGATTWTPPAETFVDNGATTFPTGYADRPEYEDIKCDLAQLIKTRAFDDMTNISRLNLVGLSLSAIAGGLGLAILTPIPFDDVIGLAGAILTVVVTLGAANGVIAQVRSYVQTMDICLMYDAGTAQDAVNNIAADIDAQSFPLLDSLSKEILKKWFSLSNLNTLFSSKPSVGDLPNGDCSGCGGATCNEANYLTFGTVTSGDLDGGQFTADATDPVNFFRIDLFSPCGWTLDIDASNVTTKTKANPTAGYFQVWEHDGSGGINLVYDSDTLPVQSFPNFYRMQLGDTVVGEGAFDATITLTAP